MPTYQSQYTGQQIDAAVGAINSVLENNGFVSVNGLETTLGNYLTINDASNTYLTINDASSTYLPLSGGTLTGSLTVPSSLSVQAENSAAEGGQIILAAAPGYSSGSYPAIIDVYQTSLRIHNNGAVRITVDLTNGATSTGGLTCRAFRVNNEYATFEKNNNWLSPSRVVIGRNAGEIDTDRARIGVTNGNLHIDAYKDKGLYLNHYCSAGNVYFNGSTYYINGGYYNGAAASATYASSYLANRGSVSGSTHAAALKAWFDSNKSTEPRNALVAHYSSAHNNGSLCMGYFLSGYDSGPYGGFFVCHYNWARYVGISAGTYTQYDITMSSSSSKLIKENILPINNNEAKKLLEITPVSFDYKKDYGEKNQYGFIAEELYNKFSYPIVFQGKDLKELEKNPTLLQIDYIKFIPHIVKLLQIQEQRINELEEKLNKLSI